MAEPGSTSSDFPSGSPSQSTPLPAPSTPRPCFFQGRCPDLCPDLELDSSSPFRCAACGHLSSHHSTEAPPESKPSGTDSSFTARWLKTLHASRNRHVSASALSTTTSTATSSVAAQQEVRRGFRPKSRLEDRLGTGASGTPAGKGKAKVPVNSKGKQPAPQPLPVPVQVHGIYFIPRAYETLISVSNPYYLCIPSGC